MRKHHLINWAYRSGLYRLLTPVFGGHSSILLLHRVRPSGRRGDFNDWLEVTPDFLESYILERKREGWRFISLDFLLDNFEECRRRKRNMVVTLDDGYRDNHRFAWPLFRKHAIPFTVYVTNAFPNGTADLWWYRLAATIARNSALTVTAGGEAINVSCTDRDAAFRGIRRLLLSLSPEERKGQMDRLAGETPWAEEGGYAMTWEDIRDMAADPLCTIGCHTMTHQNLALLSTEEARREICQSRTELEENIGKEVAHFAYPYGSRYEISERVVGLVKETGFRSAVTTDVGNLFPDHCNTLYLLPRIPLHQGGTFERIGQMALAGLNDAVARPSRMFGR